MHGRRTVEEAKKILASAVNEAGYRSAASRAYIGTFQHIVRHPKLREFTLSKEGEDHRRLIGHLKQSTDPLLSKIGQSRLPRLRSLRNHADYELDVPFTKELAQEAIDDAEEIVHDWLPVEDDDDDR